MLLTGRRRREARRNPSAAAAMPNYPRDRDRENCVAMANRSRKSAVSILVNLPHRRRRHAGPADASQGLEYISRSTHGCLHVTHASSRPCSPQGRIVTIARPSSFTAHAELAAYPPQAGVLASPRRSPATRQEGSASMHRPSFIAPPLNANARANNPTCENLMDPPLGPLHREDIVGLRSSSSVCRPRSPNVVWSTAATSV